MVACVEDYPWSSYHSRLDGAGNLLDPVPGLNEALAQYDNYRKFVERAIPDSQVRLMRHAVQWGQLTGNAAFIEQIDKVIGRRIEHRGPGRPGKSGK